MAQPVSVIKYNDRESVREAVEKCNGFSNLKTSDKVLIKPNLVFWDKIYPYSPYGVLTTNLVVEEVIKLLKEYGCHDITIGEGTMVVKEFGSTTEEAFKDLGYYDLKDKYGVQLKDFNEGSFTKVDLGHEGESIDLRISDDVLNADFIVNLPVLKTHNSTVVSLGLKNLKGCIDTRSKMFCHHKDITIDHFIARLGEKIPPDLTIIDGIYTIERGPFNIGKAYRGDLLVASKDCFDADVVGSQILGFSPHDILHLEEYAENNGRNYDDIEVVGEDIEKVKMPLKWDWNWLDDNTGPPAFQKLGMEDIFYPKYDTTLCSGCTYLNNALLIFLMDAYQTKPFKSMEFISGKKMISQGGYDKTFLMGKCAIQINKDNPNINERVRVKSCPPKLSNLIEVLNENGVLAREKAYYEYRENLVKRYEDKPEFDEGHFQFEV